MYDPINAQSIFISQYTYLSQMKMLFGVVLRSNFRPLPQHACKYACEGREIASWKYLNTKPYICTGILNYNRSSVLRCSYFKHLLIWIVLLHVMLFSLPYRPFNLNNVYEIFLWMQGVQLLDQSPFWMLAWKTARNIRP